MGVYSGRLRIAGARRTVVGAEHVRHHEQQGHDEDDGDGKEENEFEEKKKDAGSAGSPGSPGSPTSPEPPKHWWQHAKKKNGRHHAGQRFEFEKKKKPELTKKELKKIAKKKKAKLRKAKAKAAAAKAKAKAKAQADKKTKRKWNEQQNKGDDANVTRYKCGEKGHKANKCRS